MLEELDIKFFFDGGLDKMEDILEECENIFFLVVFENFKVNVIDIMLILLVENISGLFNDDF